MTKAAFLEQFPGRRIQGNNNFSDGLDSMYLAGKGSSNDSKIFTTFLLHFCEDNLRYPASAD